MWIASKLGFYSIVQKPPGEWHIRARIRQDLENLANLLKSDAGRQVFIEEWPDADYRWRFIVSSPFTLGNIFDLLGKSITYPNFKTEVSKTPGQRAKLGAYHDLWSGLYSLQVADSRRDSAAKLPALGE